MPFRNCEIVENSLAVKDRYGFFLTRKNVNKKYNCFFLFEIFFLKFLSGCLNYRDFLENLNTADIFLSKM
jgi:hypothetical protein